MIYLKKDGTIKKYYLEACKCILKGKEEKHEIVDNYDKTTDIYNCYTVSFQSDLITPSYKRKLLKNHIIDISKEYNLNPSIWYSLQGWESINYKDQDIQFIKMQEDIMKYMQ